VFCVISHQIGACVIVKKGRNMYKKIAECAAEVPWDKSSKEQKFHRTFTTRSEIYKEQKLWACWSF